MSATPSGKGYILLGADGGIFTFGNAHFYGSTGGMHLNARVLDLAITANGKGYWFVAADGGVFTFGNAQLPRLDRQHAPRGAGDVDDGVGARARATGWSPPTAGSSPSTCRSRAACPAVRALTNAPMVPTVRMRALPSGRGYYLLGSERLGVLVRHRQVLRLRAGRERRRPHGRRANRPANRRDFATAAVQLTPVRGWAAAHDVGLPLAFGPAAAAAADGEAVQVVDDGVGLVAELHERDADHGAGAAAAAHAVHGDADARVDVRDHVGRGGEHELAFAFGGRRAGRRSRGLAGGTTVTVHGAGS